MQSYAFCGRFDPGDYACRIAAIFEENRIVGRGLATEKAANQLIGGMSWKEAGCPAPSAGNGSAMRAGPIGLFFFDNPQDLIQAARDQSLITHQDVRCLAGSVVIAGAVALGLDADTIDAVVHCRHLAEYADAFDADFAGHIRKLPEWISLPPEKAVVPISSAGKPAGYVDGWPGISPFVVGSVLWSLYSFLRTPDDYRETIKTSIAVGGDVDTTGAMAGAISGAYLGLEAIPQHLALRVHDNHTWGHDELIDLADRCYLIKSGG